MDETPVWSLSCFYIRKANRKQGVTAALIEAALETARSAGAPALEAYPLDASLTPSTSHTGYHVRAGWIQRGGASHPPAPHHAVKLPNILINK